MNESDVPSNARFFAIEFLDPILMSTDAADVAHVSVLNKAYELSQVIKHITAITHIPKVNLVGHSMGGIDARAYVEDLASSGDCYDYINNIPYYKSPCSPGDPQAAYAGDVNDIITIDTPHQGTPLASDPLRSLLPDSYACQKYSSVNSIELTPNSTLLNSLNYTGTSAISASPSNLTVPITAIGNYFSDVSTSWTGLSGDSDDAVPLYSQCITNDGSTPSCTVLPAANTPADITNISFSYHFGPPPDQSIKDTSGCWIATLPMLHFLNCIGFQPEMWMEMPYLLTNATVPWITSWSVLPIATTLGNPITISYSTFDMSKAQLATAELWRAPDSAGKPGSWQKIDSQALSGGGPLNVTFTDVVTETGTYWYGTHVFDTQGNEDTEPEPVEVSITAGQAPTVVLQASPNQVTFGAPVSLTATVRSTVVQPTGSVVFFDGNGVIGTPIALNASGQATYSTSSLTPGLHQITAHYSGDNNFPSATSSPVSETVLTVSPVINVTPSSGLLGVTSFMKSGIGFTPNGAIRHVATYPDGSKSILNGTASATGTSSYRVTYSNETGVYSQTDTDVVSGQTSNTITWTVSNAVMNDFSVTLNPTAQNVSQGSAVTYTVSTATTSGTAQSVSFSAGNLPSGLTASFSPATVTSGGQSTLTITASSTATAGTYTSTILGTGTFASHSAQAAITVIALTPTAGRLTTPSTNIGFPQQTVNTASIPAEVSLVNSGGSPLTITSLTASPQFYPSFLNGLGLPITLQPGEYANMQVVFIPGSVGPQTGTINLFNTTNVSPFTFTVAGTGVAAPVTTGNIQINTTFNGSPYSGSVYYNLTGPESYFGSSATYTYFDTAPGAYTLSYATGGPGGATFTGITPSATQTLSAGATIAYTLNFTGQNTFSIIQLQPMTLTVGVGASTQFQVGVCITNGATQTVSLSMTGAPPGASVTWSANPISAGCTNNAATATISTSASTPPGIYPLTVTGTNQDGYSNTYYLPVMLTVALPPAAPGQLVSLSSGGAQGNDLSGAAYSANGYELATGSANGQYVAFVSQATNFISKGSNGQPQIYVRNTMGGTTSLASVASDGTPADQGAILPSISLDGRYVAFSSHALNLPGASPVGHQGIYVFDVKTGSTTRIDLASDGTSANSDSCCGALSADGRYVVFFSAASNLMPSVTGGGVFVFDRKTSQMSLASVSSDGSVATSAGESPRISADGRYVVFWSSASNLVSTVTNGKTNAFVHDFVGGATTVINVASDGTEDDCGIVVSNTSPLAISADGRYVAFASCGQSLTPGYRNSNGNSSVFIHDMVTGSTSPLEIDSQNDILGAGNVGSFSSDGRFVTVDDYLEDRTTGGISLLNVASDGSAGNGSAGPATVSSDGSSVTFPSMASNLVASDTNSTTDVFEFTNPFIASSRLASVSIGSPLIASGSGTSGTIALNAPAPSGGATVSLWSDNSAVQLPATVVVPGGATSAPFAVTTSIVPTEMEVALIASYNGGSGVAILTLEPTAILSASPNALDFGYQAIATTSAAQPIVLTNTGSAALILNSIQLATGQVFSITSNTCGASLAAGGSCTVSVAFDPSAIGPASDSLQINFGDPATVQPVNLTGSGALPSANLSPNPVSFGSVTVGSSSSAVATVSNTGNAPLSGISVGLSGTNAGDFQVSGDGCSGVVVPGGSSCQVTIAFNPQAVAPRQATLSVADNAAGSPQTATLAGTGIAKAIPSILIAPSAFSILTTDSLSVTAVVTAGAGNPIPTGSVSLTGGGYTSSAMPLTDGSAQVNIPAGQLGIGTNTLTVAYTPDSRSSPIFGNSSASAQVVVSILTSIQWSAPPVIIHGTALSNVLTASSNAGGNGTYSYTATPNGGSPSTVSSSSILPAGSYALTALFTPNTNQYTGATATIPLLVSGESVWVIDGASGGTAELAGNGYGVTSATDPGANAAMAIDNAGNVWTVGSGPLLEETSQIGTTQKSITNGGGLNSPAGVAIDGASQVWVTNGNNSISLFTDSGSAISPPSGYTDTSLSTPTGIVIDLGGSVWIANKGNNSVTRILGAAAPVAPLSTAAKNNTTGAKP